MREILFRGKTILDNEWVIGAGIYKSEGHTWIIIDDVTKTENRGTGSDAINSETAGQYTGLTDKNGKKIFERDIVKWNINYAIVWQDCKFVLKKDINAKSYDYVLSCFDGTELEIIGNIHDDPELLRTPQNDEVRE
jgi:hypothetical protein